MESQKDVPDSTTGPQPRPAAAPPITPEEMKEAAKAYVEAFKKASAEFARNMKKRGEKLSPEQAEELERMIVAYKNMRIESSLDAREFDWDEDKTTKQLQKFVDKYRAKATVLEEKSRRESHAADQAPKPGVMAFKNSSKEFAENPSAEAETTVPVSKALQSDRREMRNLLAKELESSLDRIEKMVLGREGEKFRYSKEDADSMDRDYQTFVNMGQDSGFDPEKNKDEPWAQAMNRLKKLADKLRPPTA